MPDDNQAMPKHPSLVPYPTPSSVGRPSALFAQTTEVRYDCTSVGDAQGDF